MKFYSKLFFVQGILAVLLAGFAYAIWDQAQREVLEVKSALQSREARVFDRIFELSRAQLKAFAWDYSWWQDLIDYIESPDPEWIAEQFDQVLDTYDTDFMAIYDADGHLVSSVLDSELQPSSVNLPQRLDETVLSRPKEQEHASSFQMIDGVLAELYFSPVVPQQDIDRSGPHFGYFVVGRFWGPSSITNLGFLSGFTISMEAPGGSSANWNGSIHFERQLNGLDGTVTATLHLSKSLPVADRIIQNQIVNYWVLLFITCTVIVTISIFIRLSISKPLKHISVALKTGRTDTLDKISKSQREFYHLTQLIKENYERKILLEEEIEKRIQIEHALKASRDEAERANRAKARFLTNMSHETRTPLHTIAGYASLLKDSILDAEQEQSVEHIQASCDHLVKMLSDIIDLSSIEADAVSPTLTGVDLQELNYELIAAAESQCFRKPIRIQSELSDEAPHFIVTDYARLRRVLLCLIDNAIKFTKNGSITLRTRCERLETGIRLSYEIEDTGIGIAEDDIKQIFNAFYQADDTDAREHEGGGLGLAVARGISQLLGADLSVSSKKGAYTMFRLSLIQSEADLARAEKLNSSGGKLP